MERDETDNIERMEAFEDKFGVRFSALYAASSADEDEPTQLVVRGEVHATSKAGKIKESIQIVLAVYDAKGRVIGTNTHYLIEDEFFGFEVFEITTYDLPAPPSRIRLYPKAA